MEVGGTPIYFKSPAGPQSREMRWWRKGPVPDPHAHLTQFMLLRSLRLCDVFRGCDFNPKNRSYRGPKEQGKWRARVLGNINHPRRGRKDIPHTELENAVRAGPDRAMGKSSNLGFPMEDHMIRGKQDRVLSLRVGVGNGR